MKSLTITRAGVACGTDDMAKNGMRPVHPGEVLREDFLLPLGMSANRLAQALRRIAPSRGRQPAAVRSRWARPIGLTSFRIPGRAAFSASLRS